MCINMGCVIHQTSHAASPTNQPTKPHPPPKNRRAQRGLPCGDRAHGPLHAHAHPGLYISGVRAPVCTAHRGVKPHYPLRTMDVFTSGSRAVPITSYLLNRRPPSRRCCGGGRRSCTRTRARVRVSVWVYGCTAHVHSFTRQPNHPTNPPNRPNQPTTHTLSPTPSPKTTLGKTLAYLLPLLSRVNPEEQHIQLLVLAPSRELAAQIASVATEVGLWVFVLVFCMGIDLVDMLQRSIDRPAPKEKRSDSHPTHPIHQPITRTYPAGGGHGPERFVAHRRGVATAAGGGAALGEAAGGDRCVVGGHVWGV